MQETGGANVRLAPWPEPGYALHFVWLCTTNLFLIGVA